MKKIIYTKEFKLEAIKKYKEGINPKEIFKEKIKDFSKYNKDYLKETLIKWIRKYEEKGEKAFIGIGKNTKKVLSKNWEKELDKLDLEKQIEYLKTKVIYLEAERGFLIKLPIKKQNY